MYPTEENLLSNFMKNRLPTKDIYEVVQHGLNCEQVILIIFIHLSIYIDRHSRDSHLKYVN